MLKMGLESVAIAPQYNVFDSTFDRARMAARAPVLNMKWPLAYGRLNLEDTITEVGEDDKGPYVNELIYHYQLGYDTESNLLVFFFAYNWATFLVPLNDGDFAAVVSRTNAINAPGYELSIVQADLVHDA